MCVVFEGALSFGGWLKSKVKGRPTFFGALVLTHTQMHFGVVLIFV